MEPGQAIALAHDGGALVLRLDAIRPADMTDPAVSAEATALSARARDGIAEDIFAAFAEALRSRTDIVIDQAALNAVNAQFQ
jgi:peptidyl-prolyl cis-trans isomerase D